jgi:hypothetical protein
MAAFDKYAFAGNAFDVDAGIGTLPGQSATFFGKQAGAADPVLAHESVLEPFTDTPTFAGVQAGQANPTISGALKRRPEDLDECQLGPSSRP